MHVHDIDYDLSCTRVLAIEDVHGVKPADTAAIDAEGRDRRVLADRLVRGVVKMLPIDGCFHADPHPGNVKIELDSGRITFLDARMVDERSVAQRVNIGRLMLAAWSPRPRRSTH